MIKKLTGRFRRNEEKRLVFQSSFSLGRDGLPWCLRVIEKVFVELGVFIIGHFRLRTYPDGLHRVQYLVFDDNVLLPFLNSGAFLTLILVDDRVADKIGVPFD